jgi:cytochrome b involved in lipid metabolism
MIGWYPPCNFVNMVRKITRSELSEHQNDPDNVWLALHGKVYDVTDYAEDHPGGVDRIMENTGIQYFGF